MSKRRLDLGDGGADVEPEVVAEIPIGTFTEQEAHDIAAYGIDPVPSTKIDREEDPGKIMRSVQSLICPDCKKRGILPTRISGVQTEFSCECGMIVRTNWAGLAGPGVTVSRLGPPPADIKRATDRINILNALNWLACPDCDARGIKAERHNNISMFSCRCGMSIKVDWAAIVEFQGRQVNISLTRIGPIKRATDPKFIKFKLDLSRCPDCDKLDVSVRAISNHVREVSCGCGMRMVADWSQCERDTDNPRIVRTGPK